MCKGCDGGYEAARLATRPEAAAAAATAARAHNDKGGDSGEEGGEELLQDQTGQAASVWPIFFARACTGAAAQILNVSQSLQNKTGREKNASAVGGREEMEREKRKEGEEALPRSPI